MFIVEKFASTINIVYICRTIEIVLIIFNVLLMKKPTDAELEVLSILWKKGPCTVREVNAELSQNREVVYTTTLKMMQVMTDRGFLDRDTSNRTHIYSARIDEEEIQESLVDKMLNTAFGGSSLKLVVRALGHENTSAEDLEEIKKIIKKLETGKQ